MFWEVSHPKIRLARRFFSKNRSIDSLPFGKIEFLISCLQNEYICAALNPCEMSVIIPLMRKLLQCDSLEEMLTTAGWTDDLLMDEIPIPQETLDFWKENDLRLHEKYFLTFVFASAKLENLRYHTCQICGADYFSKEVESDVCDKCTTDIYKNFVD